MALSSIDIFQKNFDNEPLVRSLTAAISGAPGPILLGNEVIQWAWEVADPSIDVKGEYLSAQNLVSLVPGTTGTITTLSTAFFKISSSETYDYRTTNYKLFTQPITINYLTGNNIAATDTYTVIFDTFPNIDQPVVFFNFENTNYSKLFYRTVANPYNFRLSAAVSQSLVNPTNFLLSSQDFFNWLDTTTTPANVVPAPYNITPTLSVKQNTYIAPDLTKTASIFQPLTTDFFIGRYGNVPGQQVLSPVLNGIRTVTNLLNTNRTSTGNRTVFNPFSGIPATGSSNGPYTVIGYSSANFLSFFQKYNARFTLIRPSTNINGVTINAPGSNFSVGDVIVVGNSTFGELASTSRFSFQVESLYNLPHEKYQNITLEPGTYTCSVFTNQISSVPKKCLYFRGLNQGDIIFDLQQSAAYNYGNWFNGYVQPDVTNLYDNRITTFNTNISDGSTGIGIGFSDSSYIPFIDGGGEVYTIIPLTATNKLLVGGCIKSYSDKYANSYGLLGGRGLHRLNSDGTIDQNWILKSNQIGRTFGIGLYDEYGTGLASGLMPKVNTIAISGNKIYVGGKFTTHNSISGNGSIFTFVNDSVYRIARYDLETGGLDTTFTASICSDGFLIGEELVEVNSITFAKANPNISGDVDKIIVGGFFTKVNGQESVCLACLTGDGGTCSSQYFNVGTWAAGTSLNGVVTTVAVDDTLNRVYLGGVFNRYRGITKCNNFVAINSTGGNPLSSTVFSPNISGFNSDVRKITLFENKIYVGGNFSVYDGQNSWGLARLNTDGKLDTSFNINSPLDSKSNTTLVWDIVPDTISRKIYVGGYFAGSDTLPNKWQNIPNNSHIIRLNLDGTKDTSFNNTIGVQSGNPFFNSWSPTQIRTIALSANNSKIFVGGSFSKYGTDKVSYGTTSIDVGGNLIKEVVPGSQSWQRCSASFTLSAPTTSQIYLGVTTNTTSVSSAATEQDEIAIWGAQINQGTINARTPYISTVQTRQTQTFNIPFFNFNYGPNQTNIPLLTGTTIFAGVCSFNAGVPVLCSVQFSVSARDTFDSLYPWYTPHIFNNSISGIFVQRFLQANFIGFPTSYFDASGRYFTGLNFSTYTNSQGLSFYGEGHGQTINLSAKNSTNIQNYIWNIGQAVQNPSINNPKFDAGANRPTVFPISTSDGTFFTNISTQLNNYPIIPITLFVEESSTNSMFRVLTSGPYYFFNDSTGVLSSYPFFYSTIDTAGNENPSNNRYRSSIKVESYGVPGSSFNPGMPETIFLPTRNYLQTYNAFLNVSLSGYNVNILDPCYNRYNIVWKWSTFTTTNYPSSWRNINTTGPFPKLWNKEANTITNLPKKPTNCTSSSIVWTLSTPHWEVIQVNPGNVFTYSFTLQTLGNGTTPYTVSSIENTPIYIRASTLVSCNISASPFDWQYKEYTIFGESYSTIYSRGEFKIYTNNRYVPLNTIVNFQNLSIGLNNARQIDIDFDNGTSLTLLSSQVYNNFSTTYTQPGKKTVTATIYYYPQVSNDPIVEVFSNIIEVIPEYDTIDTTKFLTNDGKLNLPHSLPPYIAPNEWVVEDNINSVFNKFSENIEYLNDRANSYKNTPTEYYGWLGTPLTFNCPTWTWEDTECTTNKSTAYIGKNIYNTVTWADLQKIDTTFPEITTTGALVSCAQWQQHECSNNVLNPDCLNKFGIAWSWKARKQASSSIFATWKNTKCDAIFAKKWKYEPFNTFQGDIVTDTVCPEGQWSVNIPKINESYSDINCYNIIDRCNYVGIASKNNYIFTALKNQVRLLSSDYTATPISYTKLLDNVYYYSNIKNICLDSSGKLFVLDSDLNKVVSYNIDFEKAPAFEPNNIWGGYGGKNTKYGFYKPNDIHIDSNDNIWITDTGNGCIKQYSNTGSWLQTIIDNEFVNTPPISLGVDSQQNVHVLTSQEIRVYKNGNKLYSYSYTNETTELPVRISTNYNREIVYVVTPRQVLKYFRNGTFAGYIVNETTCINNIRDVFQDEYRNVLIASNGNIVKYIDLMKLTANSNLLPNSYWDLKDILIHKEEYVQNWVYNRSFQRQWDNIELFRGVLNYNNSICKGKATELYTKDKITIGQNEIVTSSVINRCIEYLWHNFTTLLKYFDPNCKN
jgi:hypothetical protein